MERNARLAVSLPARFFKLASRGMWEAHLWAGPAVSVAATRGDVDHYLAVLEDFVAELAA